ncbi:MAG: hypothetical protein K2N63_06940 [Lachnospiraceae bacterium]|nr:hypothetical protein [Lachnospiraceae bacterium]
MDQTDEMLMDLMGGLEPALLEDDHLEADLKRGRVTWLTTFIRERNWRKDAGEPAQCECVGEEGMMRMTGAEKKGQGKKKKKRRVLPIEKLPLSYEWGEAIRTDMGKRFHNSMRNMKRRAAALWGFVSGALTMAVIALSFFAIMGRKKPTA